MASSASALYRTNKRCLLLLAEVIVAVAAGLADRPDLRLHRAFVPAFAHGREPGHFALQPLLRLLELGRLLPASGQNAGLHRHILGARVEAVPRHLVEPTDRAAIALHGVRFRGPPGLHPPS